jgi:lysophospholipase L1-like esterase
MALVTGKPPTIARPDKNEMKNIIITLAACGLFGFSAHAQVASQTNYLAPVISLMEVKWPQNRTVSIVFHGHSVPAGYFKTPAVDSLHAYPNLLRIGLAEKYTNAVINVIVTAIGGEASDKGAARFDSDVLALKPDVVLIDYALNDRHIGLECARTNWTTMIEKAQAAGAKVILLTPTPDQSARLNDPNDPLNQHADQIRSLAGEYHIGLVDSLAAFKMEIARGTPLPGLMAQVNHPNARGHRLVSAELEKWFGITKLP